MTGAGSNEIMLLFRLSACCSLGVLFLPAGAAPVRVGNHGGPTTDEPWSNGVASRSFTEAIRQLSPYYLAELMGDVLRGIRFAMPVLLLVNGRAVRRWLE